MPLTTRVLTPDLLPALENLFEDGAACRRCWCMYWRIGAAYRRRPPGANRTAFHEIVRRGPPPGLLAFDGTLPIGWCQLTPLAALPWLNRTRRLWSPDDLTVWSLSCFYVRKGHRRQGVTGALVTAASKIGMRQGARWLEAYPADPAKSRSASGTGFVSTFRRTGFRIVAPAGPARLMMRRGLAAKRKPNA